MKFSLALLGLVGLAAASPVPVAVAAPEPAPDALPEALPVADAEAVAAAALLVARQNTGSTANELVNNTPCRRVTFIWARGSGEAGNFGGTLGPPVCDGLKSRLGATNVACQGIGRPYTASIGDNVLPQGTSQAAINEGVRLFNLAASRCPQTLIVGGGYSQGGAVIHGIARNLSPAVRARVVGLLTFGDTRNAQDNGQIPPFPPAQTRIICNTLDPVCRGTLRVNFSHLAYSSTVPSGVDFLVGRVNAA